MAPNLDKEIKAIFKQKRTKYNKIRLTKRYLNVSP